MAEKRAADPIYGVFATEENMSFGKAVLVGCFVGSAWTVLAFAAWVVARAATGGFDESARWTASIIVGLLAGGVLQQLWFNYRVSARLGYAQRILGFGATYFVVLAGCAWLAEWLPVGSPWAWVSFAMTYLVILAVLTVVFSAILRRRGVAYQQGLEDYRRRKG